MSKEASLNFGDVFSEVIANKADPVMHILALTYEFDEQQLLNLVTSKNLEEEFELRQMQLKVLSNMRPVVIYDARKTKAFCKLPQFIELHPFKTPGFSCHHSKAYLIVTEKAVRLVLGSFNLTATGIFKNREVLECFLWDKDHKEEIQLLAEWISFLQQGYETRLGGSSKSALSRIVQVISGRLQEWGPITSQGTSHLVYSGYNQEQNGLAMLRNQWDKLFPGEEPDSVFAVSPFFDKTPQDHSLALELQKRFPRITTLTLVSDRSVTGLLSKAHFGNVSTNFLYTIPSELSKIELARIEKLARQTGNSIKDQSISRRLHAKILMLFSGNRVLLYFGSANFTTKAWLGRNQELGICTKADAPAQMMKAILQNLSANTENRYSELPLTPPADLAIEDDEGYSENTEFPGFIELIQLVPNQDHSKVQFKFELGTRHDQSKERTLADYRISWAGIKLEIDGDSSQWIEREEFQNRLIGARNLSFEPLASKDDIFWFPFQYTDNLIAERESFLHPTSWDWMSFYLNPDRQGFAEPGEFIASETEDGVLTPDFEEVDSVIREDNCVIAMQGYLSLFSRVENDFQKKIQDVHSAPAEQRVRLIKQQVINPLEGFSRLLQLEALRAMTERKQEMIEDSDVFKLGELLQLTYSLSRQIEAGLRPEFAQLQEQISTVLKKWRGEGLLRANYVDFVIQGEKP